MALPEIKVRMTADTRSAEAGVERVTDDLNRMSAASDRASSRAGRLRTSMSGVGRGSGQMGRGIQNAAFQVGDFAVQVGAGTQASRALAMQLPQLLGGFGILGAVAGAAVAILVPLRTSLQGLTTDGRDLTEMFGTLQPLARGFANAMAAVGEFAATAGNLMLNNIDRILTIAATAAAFFAGKWVAAFIAARVATFSLSSALLFLRGAIIRTGIGVLIVAAGELVYQITRLSKAAGGFGNLLGLVGDIGKEVWARLGEGARLVGEIFKGLGEVIIDAFSRAFDFVKREFNNRVLIPLTKGLNKIISVANSIGGNFSPVEVPPYDLGAVGLGEGGPARGMDRVNEALSDMSKLGDPLESVQKIRDLLANMKDEGLTLPDILGVGDGEGGGSGGGGKKKKTLDEKLKEQEKRIADHLGRIKALTQGTMSDKLGAWGNYFDNLTSLTQTRNQKLLKIGKAFAAAQALIDAWTAHNRVLADPTLPWFARVAAAAQVLAAGLGAVNAIRSVSDSGAGGGGGGGAGGAGAAGAQAAPAPLDVRISGLTADSIMRGSDVGALLDRLTDEAGDRGLRLTVAQ